MPASWCVLVSVLEAEGRNRPGLDVHVVATLCGRKLNARAAYCIVGAADTCIKLPSPRCDTAESTRAV